MLMFSICFALLTALAHARAARLPRTELHSRQQTDPPSTICGDIVDSVNEGLYFTITLTDIQRSYG